MTINDPPRCIKSACGRAKFTELASRQGNLARLRLIWFVCIAALRDLNLPDAERQSLDESTP